MQLQLKKKGFAKVNTGQNIVHLIYTINYVLHILNYQTLNILNKYTDHIQHTITALNLVTPVLSI